jgi:hypothetical protein
VTVLISIGVITATVPPLPEWSHTTRVTPTLRATTDTTRPRKGAGGWGWGVDGIRRGMSASSLAALVPTGIVAW